MVFLNLPETREERLRREVRDETLIEARQEEEKRRIEAEKRHREDIATTRAAAEAAGEVAGEAASNERSAAWYARMKEAQDKDEPFDEPPPWE